MASTLKKVLLALGTLALAGIVLVVALFVAVIMGDNKAKARATALCGSVAAGSSADAALARAGKSGAANHELNWHKAEDGGDELLVAFPAWLPLTGYECTIAAKDGVVTAATITTVD